MKVLENLVLDFHVFVLYAEACSLSFRLSGLYPCELSSLLLKQTKEDPFQCDLEAAPSLLPYHPPLR